MPAYQLACAPLLPRLHTSGWTPAHPHTVPGRRGWHSLGCWFTSIHTITFCVSQTVLGIILGGGAGSRLYPLTKKRAKPAVPLGANYRLIDIPVSNCINSGAPRGRCARAVVQCRPQRSVAGCARGLWVGAIPFTPARLTAPVLTASFLSPACSCPPGVNKIYCLTQFNSASLNRHLSSAYVRAGGEGRAGQGRGCDGAGRQASSTPAERCANLPRTRTPPSRSRWVLHAATHPPSACVRASLLPVACRTRTLVGTTAAGLWRCWPPARPPPPRSGSRWVVARARARLLSWVLRQLCVPPSRAEAPTACVVVLPMLCASTCGNCSPSQPLRHPPPLPNVNCCAGHRRRRAPIHVAVR